MDKFSFCLTTYNKKEILEVTLENYFANKKPEYELIISDGCSTDGTVEYLQKLKAEGKIDTLILSDKRDNGEWEGYKKTLDFVKGKYFYILTDDDYFHFPSIELIISYINSHNEIDYLFADGYDYHFDKLHDLGYHHQLKRAGSTSILRNGLFNGVCGLGVFVKSELINSLNLFSEKYGKRTDKTLTLELLNSNFTGASTNLKTYVGIKNEKSNGHMHGYKFEEMENIETLKYDISKDFKIDTATYINRFNQSPNIIGNIQNFEFTIYNR